MADNQADDDDDESFGDFKFVSFPNQPFQNNGKGLPADDDEWGDFMNHSNQINGGSVHTSNGLFSSNFPSSPYNTCNFFDPVQVSQDLTQKNSSPAKEINRVELAPTPAEPEKPRWNKPQGALPLSIFGEEEVEEEPTAGNLPFGDDAKVLSKKNSDCVKKESDSNGAIRMIDLIANLYNQRPEMNFDNGSISVLSVSDLNLPGASSKVVSSVTTVAASNADANGLNSILNNLNSDSVDGFEDTGDDDGGWEFKWAESEIRTVSNDTKTKHETTSSDEYAFTFSNGVLGVDDMLDSSSRISHKADEWNLGFEFNPSSVMQNHIQVSESGSNHNLEAPKLAATDPVGEEASCNPDDRYVAPESHQFDDLNFGSNFYPSSLGEVHQTSVSDSKRKQDDDNRNFNAFPANSDVHFDVNLFQSKDAVSEVGTDQKKSQVNSENCREALSLSIFGDETPDTDEHSVFQGFSSDAPASSIRNNFNSAGSNLSISDLIWNLYGQAEQKTSHVTPEVSENGQVEPDSNLVTGDDDFNDDSWEFKDASHGTRSLESVENTHSNHKPQVSENGLQPLPTVWKPDLINEDESWEFKAALCLADSKYQGSVIDHKDFPLQSSTKVEPPDYVDFYCKLTDELCNAVLFHLQNLKNCESVATLNGEEAKAKALQEEMQELFDMLHQYNVLLNEHISEDQSTRNVCLDKLIEVLKEPRFQPLESDYRLTSRLSMAETNIRSAIELLKDALSTLKVLQLRSREEQSSYLTMWSKIALVCSEELKHGAFIWNKSAERNVHDQILANPKGYQYIHALGEICRVAEIVGLSAKLHKPWMLLGSADPARLFALLNESYTIWSDSGLEDALLRVSNQSNVEQESISRQLLESIKYIHELDEQELQSCIISGEETTCQLSALPAGFIPGLKMVTWNGKQYFLTLANLWINLVNSDFPC
ncbi:uncharacterized protein LOC129306169 isoform X2 [Prosopis cineraria]|uniref:uncharacterized protein LOC129306169 isoform X2 n=1 Tax=Prosopis cineraria TaxID=364024 RepID=UPI0024103050|nr:uncharacterized protein LOC129306169 isoform X2 [Prosopis cineraria]